MCYTVIHLTINLFLLLVAKYLKTTNIINNIYKIHKSGTSQHTADAGESRTSYTGGDPELPTERPGTHFFISRQLKSLQCYHKPPLGTPRSGT